jgi:SAM-dependent methyltransferase
MRGGVIARCRECAVAFTVPARTDTELAALYDDDYFDSWLSALPGGAFESEAAVRNQEPRVRFLSQRHPPGAVLDVGAATGFFLAAARQHGWQGAAVEPNARAWAWARERFALPPAAPSLTALEPHASFDAICFWHSLEHHAEPRGALAIAAERLRPAGVVIIECPNAGSLDARLRGNRWTGWHLPYHTVHFAPDSLHRELERVGLRVESIRRSLLPPLATLLRGLRSSRPLSGVNRRVDAPFLLRQDPGSRGARLARIFSGRDMLVVARAP